MTATLAPARDVLRLLPPEEWSRLEGTEAAALWPHLNPADSRIVVVERDGAIVGCWVGVRLVHFECVWIDPRHRGRAPGIVRRLVRGMAQVARAWGARTVITAALTEDVKTLIGKLGGTQVPGETYVLPIPREVP